MGNWDDDRPNNYIDAYYEDNIFAKLNAGFDKFVKKVGKKYAILLLLGIFAVAVSIVVFSLHMMQQRMQFNFGGNTFGLISIDKASGSMILEDQNGIPLTFKQNGWTFSIFYLDDVFSVSMGPIWRQYVFSDGSTASSEPINQNTEVFSWDGTFYLNFPAGQVPHFNDMQNAESAALAMFRNFYANYTEIHIYVLVAIGSFILWFFVVIKSFFREELHEMFRPFKKVWVAEWEDNKLAELGGKVSVAWLIVGLIVASSVFPLILLIP